MRLERRQEDAKHDTKTSHEDATQRRDNCEETQRHHEKLGRKDMTPRRDKTNKDMTQKTTRDDMEAQLQAGLGTRHKNTTCTRNITIQTRHATCMVTLHEDKAGDIQDTT